MKEPIKYQTVDEYIASCPPEVGTRLQQIRLCIQSASPEAAECISYGMPAYRLGKVLVYFAACKNHIGFYPTPSAIEAFKKELDVFKTSKGAVQFPFTSDIPCDLVGRIVRFRIEELGG